MKYIWNTETNCFDGYLPKYKVVKDGETGKNVLVEVPCETRLYTDAEVKSILSQCVGEKTLKSVGGAPAIVDRYTTEELYVIKIKRRIAELKAKLKETKDSAILVLDGEMTQAEYEPIKAQRKAWREEIKRLEAQL